MPTRSAWPGRGWRSGFSVTPGAGDISSCHFGHSVLWITIDTGEPSVRPWRTPPSSSTSSRSKRMRGPATEPEPAPRELVADLLHRDGQAGGKPLDHHREGGAVGLTGGQVAQHGIRIPGGGFAPRAHFPRYPPPYHEMIASPTRIAVHRAGREERAERHGLFASRGSRITISSEPDDGAVDEAEEQPEEHLAPAEPAQRRAEHERQLHVAEAHAARRHQVQHEERSRTRPRLRRAHARTRRRRRRRRTPPRAARASRPRADRRCGSGRMRCSRSITDEREQRGGEHQVRGQRPRVVEPRGRRAEQRAAQRRVTTIRRGDDGRGSSSARPVRAPVPGAARA